jgi:hypothetical protein
MPRFFHQFLQAWRDRRRSRRRAVNLRAAQRHPRMKLVPSRA